MSVSERQRITAEEAEITLRGYPVYIAGQGGKANGNSWRVFLHGTKNGTQFCETRFLNGSTVMIKHDTLAAAVQSVADFAKWKA